MVKVKIRESDNKRRIERYNKEQGESMEIRGKDKNRLHRIGTQRQIQNRKRRDRESSNKR